MISRDLDQFFTTPETANECLKFLHPYLNLKSLSWIEPSAGKGIFLKEAKSLGLPRHSGAFDLMPQSKEIQQSDFLDVDLSIVFKSKSQRLCLGNPPFGKNSSLAIKFFNHAAQHSNVIAMIFPATFSKASVQKRLNKLFHLKAELDLGSTPFDFDGTIRLVPVVFQIWEKSQIAREKEKAKLTTNYFSFTTKDKCDFAIQRVGNAAGKLKKDVSNLATSSHYFIKIEDVRVVDALNSIDWTSIKAKNAGNPSIAKTELIIALEEKLSI